jgi:plastocyanin
VVLGCVTLLPGGIAAQSLVDRPPNLSGGWVVGTGTVQFNFVHRFQRSDAPERKISNTPTFMTAIGLPLRSMVGFNYATNSALSPRYPNEWEFLGRVAVLSELVGDRLDLSAQVGYNLSAEGFDAELSAAKLFGPVRLLAAGRSLTDPFDSGRELAAAGGITVRLSRFLAVGGDVATVFGRPAARVEEAAWSAGVHLAIPNTPHSLSLHATNANTATLQGMSRGGSNTRYGFEFTVPITLARYFGSRDKPEPAPEPPTPIRPDSAPAPAAAPATPTPAAPPERVDTARPPAAAPMDPPPSVAQPSRPARRTVRAAMKNLAFLPRRIEIVAGTTIAWKNDDPLDHTVTAADRSFDSGVIRSGATWSRTFSRPGTYQITCTPHPHMRVTVVVTPER